MEVSVNIFIHFQPQIKFICQQRRNCRILIHFKLPRGSKNSAANKLKFLISLVWLPVMARRKLLSWKVTRADKNAKNFFCRSKSLIHSLESEMDSLLVNDKLFQWILEVMAATIKTSKVSDKIQLYLLISPPKAVSNW